MINRTGLVVGMHFKRSNFSLKMVLALLEQNYYDFLYNPSVL